ncbi:MAG: LysR family transcriptional regulator [Alphaproteobacteria bacterium]
MQIRPDGADICHTDSGMAGSFELRRLRYFVKVAELGSLTRAAEALHVAQPALSHHMRSLEAEIGAQLLARGPRGVGLTEAGARLAEEARALLAGMHEMVERVKGDAADPEGEVTIGVGQTVGSLVMVPLLEAAARRLPRVRIQVRELISGLLPDLVRSGAVDFGIAYNLATGNGIEATTVFAENLCLVGLRRLARRHLGAMRGGDLPFARIEGLPLYLSRRTHSLRELVEREARAKGIRLSIRAEVDSLYIMKELALSGSGFSILSAANVHREAAHHDLLVARLVDPFIRRKVCFVSRHGHALPRAARAVATLAIETLARIVREDVWRGRLLPQAAAMQKTL